MTEYFAIGCMSGTSLDGLDLAYVKLVFDQEWSYEILDAKTVFYDKDFKLKLENSIHLSGLELTKFNSDLGIYFGNEIQKFRANKNISKVDFIASHGHTIFHNPKENYTLQIGCGAQIHKITKCKTIFDFRTQDVALGGQGAPLVPIGDKLLFADYDFCLNLGGFANLSYNQKNKRIAYDICAVNTVMNKLVKPLGLDYDKGGELASKGNKINALFEELEALSFYEKKMPKSLGIEWVNQEIVPILNKYPNTIEDKLHTFVLHIAKQIARNLTHGKTLITGGGTFNTYLIQQISVFAKSEIIIPDTSTIDYKEALIFTLLAALRLENENNCLASVTGAEYDHSAGLVIG